MELRELRYIAEIGSTHRMSAAAQNLHISQPALHNTLKKVEAELGTVLFYRKGHELYPTDTGELVLKAAADADLLMLQMTNSIAATQNLKSGTIKMGFPSIVGSLFLPELLIDFKQKYPQIKLYTSELGGSALVNEVAGGSLDIAIAMRPIHNDALNEIPLIQDHVAVGVSPMHEWAERRYITVNDFQGVPFNTFDPSFNLRAQIEERFRQEGVEPLISFGGKSTRFLYQLSALDGTPLVLPKPVIDYYSQGRMKLIPFRPEFPWELCIIFPRNAFITNACKAMISHIQHYQLEHWR